MQSARHRIKIRYKIRKIKQFENQSSDIYYTNEATILNI